jgi:ectoine hydroxylase-related dioxygenase (phytanoyl-CoA dioxygenase family)
MPAGAAIVLQGNLIHRGGANRSSAARLAVTNQYCQPWARPQENFFLAVPRAQAAALSPRLQALLGYEIWPPFMGHVTGSHPVKALERDWSEPIARP